MASMARYGPCPTGFKKVFQQLLLINRLRLLPPLGIPLLDVVTQALLKLCGSHEAGGEDIFVSARGDG